MIDFNFKKLDIGQELVVVKNLSNHQYNIGDVVRVVDNHYWKNEYKVSNGETVNYLSNKEFKLKILC